MSTFTLEKYKEITGRDQYFKLIVDGNNQYKEFFERIKDDPQLLSEHNTILRWMDKKSRGERIPPKKCHTLDGGDELEFRTEHLRIYAFHQKGTGKIVTLWGMNNKSEQPKDINKFHRLKVEYKESINK